MWEWSAPVRLGVVPALFLFFERFDEAMRRQIDDGAMRRQIDDGAMRRQIDDRTIRRQTDSRTLRRQTDNKAMRQQIAVFPSCAFQTDSVKNPGRVPWGLYLGSGV